MSYILFSFGFIKSTTTGYISQIDHLSEDNTIKSIYQIFIIASFISFVLLILKDFIISTSLNIFGGSGEINQNASNIFRY